MKQIGHIIEVGGATAGQDVIEFFRDFVIARVGPFVWSNGHAVGRNSSLGFAGNECFDLVGTEFSDVTGRGFELGLKRDLGALMSWRIEAIRAEGFSPVLLSVMEAIAAVTGAHGVMVLDLARVFDEATARTEARKAIA